MKPARFTYRRAASTAEALALLQHHGDEARLLAGGQSLVPMMNFRIARPSVLIDLNPCRELAGIRVEGERLVIGAMTRQRDAERHPLVLQHCPLIAAALAHAGSPAIRNRGTVGGSIANAYPLAQILAVAAALDAEMVAAGREGDRVIPAAAFFRAELTTDLASDELLREIRFPCRAPGTRQVFREAGNHAGGEAQVVLAAEAAAPRVRLALLGLAPVPLRLHHAEAALAHDLSPGAHLAEAWPADLAAASEGDAEAAYRRALAWALLEDAVLALGPAEAPG